MYFDQLEARRKPAYSTLFLLFSFFENCRKFNKNRLKGMKKFDKFAIDARGGTAIQVRSLFGENIFSIFGGFLKFLTLLIEFVEFLKLFQHFFAAFFHDF